MYRLTHDNCDSAVNENLCILNALCLFCAWKLWSDIAWATIVDNMYGKHVELNWTHESHNFDRSQTDWTSTILVDLCCYGLHATGWSDGTSRCAVDRSCEHWCVPELRWKHGYHCSNRACLVFGESSMSLAVLLALVVQTCWATGIGNTSRTGCFVGTCLQLV